VDVEFGVELIVEIAVALAGSDDRRDLVVREPFALQPRPELRFR
jgi:hypothetical protein